MDDIRLRFGRNLRCYRVRANLTREELANHHGLSTQYLHQIENGIIDPPITLQYLLCRTLKIELADLYAKWDVLENA